MTDAGEQGKQLGMHRAIVNANPAWKAAADRAVMEVAVMQSLLTADDVMGRIDPNVFTHELRALGAVMKRAAKDGLIEKANVMPVMCARPNCHKAPITVWKSLVFKGGKS